MIPVILSGGSGTRLWPLSRELHPKQFLALESGGPTLFQSTLARLADLPEAETPIVVANAEHRFLAAEQLLESGVAGATILLEPEGRNTAPALAAAALAAGARDPEAMLLALPADHVIRDVAAFHAAVAAGVAAGAAGKLVVFGVDPDRPEPGYGYIRAEVGDDGPAVVAAFVEKPGAEQAAAFLASGGYFWNSGMFLLRADRYLAELERYAPEVLNAVRQSWDGAHRDLDFLRLASEPFRRSPSISIDYAVMERTHDAVVVPLAAGWSDVGSWDALAALGGKDKSGNVAVGDTLLAASENVYVRAESRLVAALGVTDQVIVETPDAVLVAGRRHAQDVKRLVAILAENGRSERLVHRRVHRPWGWYEGMASGERFQVKRILIKQGASLSLQRHRHRAEHWVIVHGTAEVLRGDETFLLCEDESTYIPMGVRHRLGNKGKIPLELIEVQTGSYFGEDDIERFDDDYGRGSAS